MLRSRCAPSTSVPGASAPQCLEVETEPLWQALENAEKRAQRFESKQGCSTTLELCLAFPSCSAVTKHRP
ncbi:unnamed protein product [Symbiodinium natans]|uniref:Uncharacterized protein n=1 Tax=Symbiodinium natans TaxID=878477 RepID=A0A812IPF0_9DINO|nr:unnamed protein product [Symbiodinium natans]